jgi:hypothetical protein
VGCGEGFADGDGLAFGDGELLAFGEGETLGLAAGEGDFLVTASAVAIGAAHANAAMHAVIIWNLFFIDWGGFEVPFVAGSDEQSNAIHGDGLPSGRWQPGIP